MAAVERETFDLYGKWLVFESQCITMTASPVFIFDKIDPAGTCLFWYLIWGKANNLLFRDPLKISENWSVFYPNMLYFYFIIYFSIFLYGIIVVPRLMYTVDLVIFLFDYRLYVLFSLISRCNYCVFIDLISHPLSLNLITHRNSCFVFILQQIFCVSVWYILVSIISLSFISLKVYFSECPELSRRSVFF